LNSIWCVVRVSHVTDPFGISDDSQSASMKLLPAAQRLGLRWILNSRVVFTNRPSHLSSHLSVERACRKLTHHPLRPTRGVCENTLILALADGQKTITVRHSKLMHHRLTRVPEPLGTSHSAYETAVESFRALVGVKMAPTRHPQGSDNQYRLAELNPRGKHRLGIGKLNV